MIRINKPADPPEVLRRRGEPATRKFCAQIDADPGAYQSFGFNARIYGHPSVKEALRRAQHDKCAFCESKVTHISHGDVEHFRPKAGYRQRPGGPLVRPGYYWLAYDWSNLLFCCQLCNQQFKGNHFPLAARARRARSHRDDVSRERPLLINPAIEDPSEFLEFRENIILAINGNARGVKSIEVFGLDRPMMEDRRLAWFLSFRLLKPYVRRLIRNRDKLARLVAKSPTPELRRDLAEAEGHVERYIGDSAEYAAMNRAALQSR